MLINLSNAIKKFYPNPVLEQVYFEAIANAIYANATEIDLLIDIESYSKPETLKITISDNGDGFNEINFNNFSELLKTEGEEHKGLGRLVFINYFNKIDIESIFDNKKRAFSFTEKFEGKASDFPAIDFPNSSNKTILKFSQYSKKDVYKYDFLIPKSIKKAIELHFFPFFHQFKKESKNLKISISLTTQEPNPEKEFYNDKRQIIVKEIPDLDYLEFPADTLSIFDKMEMYYSIKQNNTETSIITAICADNRTIPLEIVPKENMPTGYEIIFLFYSTYFNGKVNSSRQKLDVENYIWITIKSILISKINSILNKKIPSIKSRNDKIKSDLENKYPHYYGLFDETTIGLIDREKTLEIAQKKFFQAQKKILETTTLNDEEYEQAIGISSRLLAEYILYRNIIIEKLKKIDKSKKEDEIHNLIVPKTSKLKGNNVIKDIYTSNVWLFDDKFMTYSTILSEHTMDTLIQEITQDEHKNNETGRPDISMIFSDNPEKHIGKVDVVIIELKKFDLKLAKREELRSQFKQRARRLLKYFPNKIQRIFFYGIIDFTKEFERSLREDKFIPIFSEEGQIFYGRQPVIYEDEISQEREHEIDITLLSFEAFWKDAERRNTTFLKILKEGFKNEKYT